MAGYYDPNMQMIQQRYQQLMQDPSYAQYASQQQAYPNQQYQNMMLQQQQQSMQPQQTVSQPPQAKLIMVTSIDEVKSSNVLDGALYVFKDTSNDQFYTRQFNVGSGTAPIKIYACTTPDEKPAISEEQNEISAMKSEISTLKTEIETLKEDFKNVQSANVGADNGTIKSTGTTDDAAIPTNATTGGRSKRNN